MATRKITYASAANLNGGATVYSAAETREQLYAEYPEIQILSNGMKAWVRKANDATDKGYGLSTGDSKLPEGDVLLYFLVEKNDSGTDDAIPEVEAVIDQWLKTVYAQLREEYQEELPF